MERNGTSAATAIKRKLHLINKRVEGVWHSERQTLYDKIDPTRLGTLRTHIESFAAITIQLVKRKAESMKSTTLETFSNMEANENLQVELKNFILKFFDDSAYVQRLMRFLEGVERKFKSQGLSFRPEQLRINLIESLFQAGIKNALREARGEISTDFVLFSARAPAKYSEATEGAEKRIPNDYENFVRKLRISCQSDSEIKIQAPGRLGKTYSCSSLGFRDEKTQEWKTLLDILQDPDHLYNIGQAYKSSGGDKQRVKHYDNQLKRLNQISIKLSRFISKTYNRQMPKDFKIYEHHKSEKPGTYRFKFQVADDSLKNKYNRYSNEQLLSEIEAFQEKNKQQPLDQIEKDKVNDLLTIANQRRLISKEKIETIFDELHKPSKGEEIETMFKEYERYEAQNGYID